MFYRLPVWIFVIGAGTLGEISSVLSLFSCPEHFMLALAIVISVSNGVEDYFLTRWAPTGCCASCVPVNSSTVGYLQKAISIGESVYFPIASGIGGKGNDFRAFISPEVRPTLVDYCAVFIHGVGEVEGLIAVGIGDVDVEIAVAVAGKGVVAAVVAALGMGV